MKLLKEVPFNKLYVGMPLCIPPQTLRKNSYKTIIRGTITKIFKESISIMVKIDVDDKLFTHVYSISKTNMTVLNNTYLDPTRM